jgi:hypothetical protein
MESLLLLAVPIIASLLTQLVKSIQSIKFSSAKSAILRVVAATLSFIGVVILNIANGEPVPLDQINVYAEALVAFFATQVPYWLAKNK